MIKSQSHAMEVQNLTIKFANVTAVNSVDLNIGKGRIVGIVGESGSGKSTLASALVGLLPNSATVTAGKVLFGNNDIVIPLKVLEEIDKHKKRQDSVGSNARNVIKIFDELREKGNINKGVKIGEGFGKLQVFQIFIRQK